MSNEYNVAPVDHGFFSATGSVALGTAGGALKSIGKTALWCIGIGAAIGLLASFGVFGVAAGASSFAIPAGFWSGVGSTVLGALGGGVVAAGLAPLAGLFGAGKGAIQSHERVSMETGAARSMDMQLAAYQAMAANNSKYNFPPQGSAMNPAGTMVSAMQNDGVMNSQQLQRA